MALRDLLRRKPKPPPFKPRGASGRTNTGGFPEIEEQNAKLIGPSGLEVFDQMYRTDPDVRRVMWMFCNPIIGATWSVQPYGGDEAEERDRKAAEDVEWALFEHMTPNFKGHLAEALPVGVRSGFAPFEEVWEATEHDGRQLLVPKTLGLRLPRSILQWNQDGGDLVSLTQLDPASGDAIELPIDDLLYYRFGAEGDNWQGLSMLRAAYKPWYCKEKLERIDLIKAERQAVGVPIAYPPANNTDPEVLKSMETVLANIRAAAKGFILAPGPHAQDLKDAAEGQGWRIELLGLGEGQSTVDVKESLEYQADKIAAAFIAEFMRLGQGTQSVGARATADVQQNPFLMAVEALAGEVEAVLEQLVGRIIALNHDITRPPKLQMSLVDSTELDELAQYVSKLVEKQALHPDNDLEDFLRERADLPPANAEAREEREAQAEAAREAALRGMEQGPEDEGQQPGSDPGASDEGGKSEPPGAKQQQLARQDRPLRPWERQMALDAVESAIDQARARLESAAAAPARQLAKDLAARAGRGAGPPRTVSAELIDAIRAELDSLYTTGRSTIQDEFQAQRDGTDLVGQGTLLHDGYTLAKAPMDAERALRRRALLAGQSVLQRVWQAINRLAVSGRATVAQMQRAGEAEAGAALRAEAQLHAAAALNQGRADEIDDHADEVRGTRYTSILDGARCEACSAADDDVLRPLDDPVRLAHRPPNPDCYGGDRCRCMEFAQLVSEEAPSG